MKQVQGQFGHEKHLPPKHTVRMDSDIIDIAYFHEDGGILFASDKQGQLNLIDINSMRTQQFLVQQKCLISHINSPAQGHELSGTLGLSMSQNGGFALFDLRTASKTMHLMTLNAVKSEFVGHLMALLTDSGSLELFDVRKIHSGPLRIFNPEFKEAQAIWIRE